MNQQKKIMVVGVGGVGGVLGARLVQKYGDAVTLIARGTRGEALRQNGLTLHSDLYGEFTVRPATVIADPAEAGVQDVILVCVKNGSLEQVIGQIAPVVGENTVVVPVMNGVSAGDILREKLARGIVLDAVIYTVSSAGSDFSITQKGGYTYIIVGSREKTEAADKAAAMFAGLMQEGGVDCSQSEDAEAAVWKKYILNCAFNVATARWGATIGQLRDDAARRADCRSLMEEAATVAKARGVALQPDLVERHMVTICEHTAPSSDSSLSRDFATGKAGEMEVFSGYLVCEAERLGIAAPVSEEYYRALCEKAAAFR